MTTVVELNKSNGGNNTGGDGDNDLKVFTVVAPVTPDGRYLDYSTVKGTISDAERMGYDSIHVEMRVMNENQPDETFADPDMAEDARKYRQIVEKHAQNIDWADKYGSKHVATGAYHDSAIDAGIYDDEGSTEISSVAHKVVEGDERIGFKDDPVENF